MSTVANNVVGKQKNGCDKNSFQNRLMYKTIHLLKLYNLI